MPELIAGKLISVQLVLLLVNMIPILPLDGGRILLAWLFLNFPKAQVVEVYYWLSFIVATTLFLITLNFLPQSIFFSNYLFIHLVTSFKRMALPKISYSF
ncbi:hypothetical protein OL548_28810 [Lysinibacillus sp. MHQ-1]|nr:hypothetical protein OL548_28810 [Lysinibacillus sp. MHQ-1]